MTVTVATLAGGASRRMGTDKAMLEQQGKSLLAHTFAQAQEANLGQICVIGREASDIPCPHHLDLEPGQGPLGGLATAFSFYQTDVLLLACDMPQLTAASLMWLADQARIHADCEAVIPSIGTDHHFTCAWYRPSLVPTINSLLASKVRSLYKLMHASKSQICPVPRSLHPFFQNCNTPDDWSAMRKHTP